MFGVNNGSGVTVTAGASAAEALVTAEVIATTILVAQETESVLKMKTVVSVFRSGALHTTILTSKPKQV